MAEYNDFLQTLYGDLPSGVAVEIRGLGGSGNVTSMATPESFAALQFDPERQWFFGVVPRAGKNLLEHATVVHCDVDQEGVLPTWFWPRPRIVTTSGRGAQAFWKLNGPVEVARQVQLARFAALAHEGDTAVCEPRRIMRLPGTWNLKYSPPKEAKVLDDTEVVYEPDDLEERLLAKFLAFHWSDGSRHALALSLGALLARVKWPVERAVRVVKLVCKRADDEEVWDRVRAVEDTYQRRAAGAAVSAQSLREELEEDKYKELTHALTGHAELEGEIFAPDGERIGIVRTFEQDMANYIISQGKFAVVDGLVCRWTGKYWKQAAKDELLAYVFNIMEGCRVLENGMDLLFPAKAKHAKAVTDVIVGRLYREAPKELPDHILPVSNGLLNIETRDLGDFDRAYAIRWVLNVEFEPKATAPTWEKYLAEASPSEQGYLQEWFGYCLYQGNPWQCMLWLYGPSGTGKSTYVRTLARILDEAATAVQADKLTQYDVASLAGKKIAVCPEIAANMMKTATMKSLVTGDPIPARFPYGRPFTCNYKGKLIWASNGLPQLDEGEGVWRRIKIVPFTNAPKVDNIWLQQKIDEELSGVLNWALDGFDRVREYGNALNWPVPASVTEYLEEYKESADNFVRFADEELDRSNPDAKVAVMELYARYRSWREAQGGKVPPMGPSFWRELRRVGLEPVKEHEIIGGKKTIVWKGATLVSNQFV